VPKPILDKQALVSKTQRRFKKEEQMGALLFEFDGGIGHTNLRAQIQTPPAPE